ncbi:MAG TPA: thiamine-phosphate kinase [Gallionellaceae bacterium]|nr:thiamine-phosphate kinase [Gallionellaceae bacterium]
MPEFDLIQRYFTRPAPGVELGVGDDAALLRIAPELELAVSTDMLVQGTHFFPGADPRLLGHKALAVNLSDMAAMGAKPRWALLALSLPAEDSAWLQAFSEGFFALAVAHGVALIGGDTTRGPLNLCVTILGEAPKGAALRRSGARPGDDIWVSGTLGEAALALAHLRGQIVLPASELEVCARRLHQPQPRVALGLALRGLAGGAIDISDGLLADLGHILEQSGAGARLEVGALPVPPLLRAGLAATAPERELARHCALAGGDDYELCFTAAPAQRTEIAALAARLSCPLQRIGSITAGGGCELRDTDGAILQMKETGYDHFA